MIERLDSEQLLEYFGEVLAEVRNRSDICIAKNGWAYMKNCSECGSEIRMYGFEFSGTEKDIAVITNSPVLGKCPQDRWKEYLWKEDIKGRIDLPYHGGYSPDVPPAKTGRWYLCGCQCHGGGWHSSHYRALASYMDLMGFPVVRISVSKEGTET